MQITSVTPFVDKEFEDITILVSIVQELEETGFSTTLGKPTPLLLQHTREQNYG